MNDKIKEVLDRSLFESELKAEILKVGRLKKAKAGQTVITPDDETQEMSLVMSGLLRVMKFISCGSRRRFGALDDACFQLR